ncbi:uncharacterized protein BCR38DRAFT_517693 [Pseudomassariella vexata]|uniref:Uncharacterized protein n=1 Tax=Pseudomassariella vexata TaxID=1141098 RepID=A0A1Y2DT18_9PEZI|nr:uncharacterized protein BCR38DRAFT_517693 [Pseudomassariella vexata]ORY62309.1 hypothetical protein BCR38DRAFT_517693 [Pseudomassariella vexata]
MLSSQSPIKRGFTSEQNRIYKKRMLNRRRAKALADLLSDIPQDVDQEDWEEMQAAVYQNIPLKIGNEVSQYTDADNYLYHGLLTSSSQEVFAHNPTDNQKWTRIHNPTNSLVHYAQVIEDSGSGVNFIHPSLAKRCDLHVYPTAITTYQVITGHQFMSDKWVQVELLGKPGMICTDWFYLSPEDAPIELLVGRRFMRENEKFFLNQKPQSDPVLLNVQSKKSEAEQAQIQENQKAADARTATLEKRRREKKEQQQKSQSSKNPWPPSNEKHGSRSKG